MKVKTDLSNDNCEAWWWQHHAAGILPLVDCFPLQENPYCREHLCSKTTTRSIWLKIR